MSQLQQSAAHSSNKDLQKGIKGYTEDDASNTISTSKDLEQKGSSLSGNFVAV